MSTAGPSLPSSYGNDTTVGTVSWANPGNVTLDDDNGAQVSLTMGQVSYYLKANNFGFAIPSGATINGVQVSYEAKTSSSFTAQESSVKLIRGGTISGSDKATSTYWSPSWTVYDRGGTSDLWGLSLTDSDVNSSSFGVGISCTDASMSSCDAYVDYVTITITYTAAAPTGGEPLVVQTRRRVRVRRATQAVFLAGVFDAAAAAATDGGEWVVASFAPIAAYRAARRTRQQVFGPTFDAPGVSDPAPAVVISNAALRGARLLAARARTRGQVVMPLPDTADADPPTFVVSSVRRPPPRRRGSRVTLYWPEDGRGVCDCEPGGVVVVTAALGVIVIGQSAQPEADGAPGSGRAIVVAGPHCQVIVTDRCDC